MSISRTLTGAAAADAMFAAVPVMAPVLPDPTIGTVEPAMATRITFVAQGTVDYVDNLLSGTFSRGDNFTVEFTFESLTPDSNPSPNRGRYLNAITALSVTVGPYSATATGENILTIFNDLIAADEYILWHQMVGPHVNGLKLCSTQTPLQLTDPTGTAFTTDALPTSPPNPEDFVSGGTFLALGFAVDPPWYFAFVVADVSSIMWSCPTDLDGDGVVSTVDLLDLLGQWGTDPGGPPDFDGQALPGARGKLVCPCFGSTQHARAAGLVGGGAAVNYFVRETGAASCVMMCSSVRQRRLRVQWAS